MRPAEQFTKMERKATFVFFFSSTSSCPEKPSNTPALGGEKAKGQGERWEEWGLPACPPVALAAKTIAPAQN